MTGCQQVGELVHDNYDRHAGEETVMIGAERKLAIQPSLSRPTRTTITPS